VVIGNLLNLYNLMDNNNSNDIGIKPDKPGLKNSANNIFFEIEKEREDRQRRNSEATYQNSHFKDGKKKKKLQMGFNYVDTFYEDIPLIIQNFFEKYHSKTKVEAFLMNCTDREGLDYLVQVIYHFQDFNLFDFLSDSMNKPNNKTDFERRKQFYFKRNNIFFTILFHCKQNTETSSFFDKHVDYFIRVNLENTVQSDLEVDYFILSLLGYKDRAKNLIVKQNEYFKNFLKSLNIKDADAMGFFNKLDITKDITNQSMEEIILIRRMIVNITLRRFYLGLNYLLNYEVGVILMIEGRIWKTIITELTKDEVLEIWIKYYSSLKNFLKKYNYYDDNPDPASIKRRIYIHTIETEYGVKITNLKDEEEHLKEKEKKTSELTEYETYARQRDLVTREREELEKETSLTPILEFDDLLRIIFQYNKKEVALVILDSPTTGIDPTLEIFEICLHHDEDLAM
jgi:hypothetical protein